MLRVNFFSVTSTLYIYRVHDRGCTCTMPKPKKHWLHFLHRRPVDPYASRRYPEYVYTSWYRVSGIMAVPRPAVDSFLPNFTHRYTATQPLVAYTPPATFARSAKTSLRNRLYSLFFFIANSTLFFSPRPFSFSSFLFLSRARSPLGRKPRCHS